MRLHERARSAIQYATPLDHGLVGASHLCRFIRYRHI